MASVFLWLSVTRGDGLGDTTVSLSHTESGGCQATAALSLLVAWLGTDPALPWRHLLSEDTKTSGSGPAPGAYFSVLVRVPQLLQIPLWKGWDNTSEKLAANFYSQWQEDKNLLRRFLHGLKMLPKLVLGH